MLTTAKPSKCKFCKQRLEVVGHKIHDECVEKWWEDQKGKIKAKAEREQKRRDRARLDGMKTIPKLIAEAQIEFNRFIRTRDALEPCISCGAEPPDLSSLHAGRDAGHYRSTGAAAHLRFDERNCHAQCVHCNQHLSGNAVEYRKGLVVRIGLANVELLESDNDPVKWDHDTLRHIKADYRAKTRELMKK